MTGIEERKILFVDSIKKSGATLQSVRTFLRTRGVPEENFRSLCLVNSANYEDSIMPSFYYKRMEGEVIFPWQTVHVT